MTRFVLGFLAVSLAVGCEPARCAPGNVPNDALQACVAPISCDGGTVNARNECVTTQATKADDSGRNNGENPGSLGGRPAGPAQDREGGSGGSNADGGTHQVDAGQPGEKMAGTAGSSAPARCGDGVVDPSETCDGNCPARCDANADSMKGNQCVIMKLEGSPKACDARCVPSEITVCTRGDGCCPMGCTYATDDDCSPSCGDGVVSGVEKCEPGSADHPCPTMRDCDDHDPCTEDRVTGAECSAQCAHTAVMRTPPSCDDGDPCTDDMPIESLSSCSYECMHSEPRQPSGSCNDTDPCTDDTPQLSDTRCAYECPHLKQQPTAADCNDGNPCTDDTPAMSRTECALECPHSAMPSGSPCGTGRMCTSAGKCEAPPAKCGDGTVAANEQCDDGNEDTTDDCVDCKVARCDDGYVKSSEECDPAAPGWSAICSALCTRTTYGICPSSGCQINGEEIPCASAGAYCSPICTQSSDCPPIPGYQIECTGSFQCTIRCSGGCPNGMHCIGGDHCGYK